MPQRLSRRRFVAATASTLIAGCAKIGSPQTANDAEHVGVLVVGAGLAGLAAANEILGRDHDLLVVEARRRPGGRVLTLREPFDEGLHAEAGAMYVGRGDELVRRYVLELGLTFAPQPEPLGLSSVYYARGQRIVVPPGSEPTWPAPLTEDERAAGFDVLW